MLKKNDSGLVWLEFELLADCPKVIHGVFTRHGGRSQAPYASLNLSYHVEDHPPAVAANIKRLMDTLHLPAIRWARQQHGTAIREADAIPWTEPPPCDALATSHSKIALLICHADCQAAIVYDPILHAAANVHSGWRGNVQNIYGETVRWMEKRYGSKPENLLVGIGPSLGPESAEFKNYRQELPQAFWDYQIRPFHFDFWEIGRKQFIAAGVLPHHIEIAKISTFTQTEDYFSFRREKKTGRNGTVVMLL